MTQAIRCSGCGHSTSATEQCPRCGWRLSMTLWRNWLASKRKGRRRRIEPAEQAEQATGEQEASE